MKRRTEKRARPSAQSPGVKGEVDRFRVETETHMMNLVAGVRERVYGKAGLTGEDRPTSLKLVEERGTCRRTVQKAQKGESIMRPGTLARFVGDAGVPGPEKAVIVSEYASSYLTREAIMVAGEIAETTMVPGQLMEVTVAAAVTIKSDGRLVTAGGDALAPYQRLMRPSLDEFGWITDLTAGLLITAPSPPVCELLGMPAELLAGSCLISDPFVARLIEITANPAEWLLVMAILVQSTIEVWRSVGDLRSVDQGSQFIQRVAAYIKRNQDAAFCQLQDVREVDGGIPTEALEAALKAVVCERALPPFDFDGWNTIRVSINKHPFLENDDVARFIKRARPLPNLVQPAGFEITWSDEHSDPGAIEVMTKIREHVASAQDKPRNHATPSLALRNVRI